MEKVGRNDPCPCGSGKKHKVCCLGRENRVAPETSRTSNALPPASGLGGLDIHPYAIVRMVTDPSPRLLSRLSKREISVLREKWTIAKMARLSTDEMVSRLAALEIDASRDAFLRLVGDRTSAWGIGDDWVEGLEKQPGMNEEDFICLAACELWKRYCPEVPSLEMLDDWVAEGYDLLESYQEVKAIGVWLRVWDTVRDRLQPDMTTFEAADTVFKCTQCFSNWIQDFVMTVRNAAITEPLSVNTGIRVLHEMLSRFTDEDANALASFRCDLGHLLFTAGHTEEGEALLVAVIHEYPRLPHGYVALADDLSRPESPSTDVERALRLLETALALPVEEAEAWGIEPRIAGLKSRRTATATGQEVCR
ncbi:MAG: SEC-C metal-binding domain-containing protein [Kiritimatiellia bacterium]|nr:SEC-C metal-binding domain-containing protein [Kiritimatiellia bacterium]